MYRHPLLGAILEKGHNGNLFDLAVSKDFCIRILRTANQHVVVVVVFVWEGDVWVCVCYGCLFVCLFLWCSSVYKEQQCRVSDFSLYYAVLKVPDMKNESC